MEEKRQFSRFNVSLKLNFTSGNLSGKIPVIVKNISMGGAKIILDKSVNITLKDTMLFTQDLAALLEAGLPVDRSLEILIGVAEKKKMKQVITEVLRSVEKGSYLSDSLAQHPAVFSLFYV